MRLIDADALYETLCHLWDKSDSEDFEKGVFRIVINAPTIDAVEVVRCKDCRYYNTTNCCDGFGWCERSGMDRGSWDNWFCADAERKTEPQKKYPTEWCENCGLWQDNNCMGVAECKRIIEMLTDVGIMKGEPQTERIEE